MKAQIFYKVAGSRALIKFLVGFKHCSLDTLGFEFHLNGGKMYVYISFQLHE